MNPDPRTPDVYAQVQRWLVGHIVPTTAYVPDLRIIIPRHYDPMEFENLRVGQLITSHVLTFRLIYYNYGGQSIAGAEYQGKPKLVIWQDPSFVMKQRVDRILGGLDENTP